MSSSEKTAFGDRYALSSGRTDHDRLRMLCEIHDPQTRALLTRAGLSGSHRYVEFGCGLGFVARWAATQAAHVTAIDLSQEHLDEARRLAVAAGLTNIEFRKANIYEHSLPAASLDYSYSRWLLVHLNRPVDAMRKIREALIPGGIMVCEETDISEVYTEPATEGYHAYRDLSLESGRKRGVNYAGGRLLHSWAREAGFEVLDLSVYHPHYLTGPHKGFWSWTFLEIAHALLKEGLLTEDRLRQLANGMRAADEDPTIMVAHCRTHQMIARKPA
jgi:SAM-dependent methyltransferase